MSDHIKGRRISSFISWSASFTMLSKTVFSTILLLFPITSSVAFPSHAPLAGLSTRQQDEAIAELSAQAVYPPPPPGPLEDNGTKLVHDKAHPWKPLRKGDIRGPCPGLNTLASHGVRVASILSFSRLNKFTVSTTRWCSDPGADR